MIMLDRKTLDMVKRGFVSMPPGSDPSMGAGPVAGGGMLTQAQASPMGGTPQGGAPMDPSMMGGGAPMDPSMAGGGAPTDPSMQGGAPMDPSMAGGAPVDPNAASGQAPIPADMAAMTPPGSSIIQLTPADFIMIIQAVQGGGANGGAKTAKPKGAGVEAKVDQILGMMGGAPQQPAQAPAQGGQPPPQQ